MRASSLYVAKRIIKSGKGMIMIELTIFIVGAPFGAEGGGPSYFIRTSTGDIYVCAFSKTYLHGNYGHSATDSSY